MHYVYLIKSETFLNKIYFGYTTNIDERIQAHNLGESTHTAKYKPWKLHAYLAFDTKKQALEFETYLKSHSGRAFAQKRLWINS
ncbi:MAG TPA: GIY-YIG nuclease family protein [Candidatus Saccharimonadales bacterium]|nr:GIY-YIG nuclease family protein [Candidatus Saccharimonadales bacterium]